VLRKAGRAKLPETTGLSCFFKGLSHMRNTAFPSPFFVGFDEIERVLERVAKTSTDGYPPYNVEKIPVQDGEAERLRITLAVAGFSTDELDLTLEDNELVISGRQKDDDSRQYLHRGIAARQFKRTFVLADGMEVLAASLDDGLLTIDLLRPEPQRLVRKIEISQGAG
jgi:HSP20 family molecular chaperone IbpA